MNVELVQSRLWEQSQQHPEQREFSRNGLRWPATECWSVQIIKTVWKAGSGKLARPVWGWGGGETVKLPRPHHAACDISELLEVSFPSRHLRAFR